MVEGSSCNPHVNINIVGSILEYPTCQAMANAFFLSKETVFWNNKRFLSLQEMRDANHRTRTIQAESESINMTAGKDTGFLTRVNPLQYEEGR